MTGRAGAGAEAADGDAGLVAQRLAQRHVELLGQLLAGQDARRLERVELAARLGRDRQHLLEVQLRVDQDGQRRRCRGQPSPRSGARSSPAPSRQGDRCRAPGPSIVKDPSAPTWPACPVPRPPPRHRATGSPDNELTSRPESGLLARLRRGKPCSAAGRRHHEPHRTLILQNRNDTSMKSPEPMNDHGHVRSERVACGHSRDTASARSARTTDLQGDGRRTERGLGGREDRRDPRRGPADHLRLAQRAARAPRPSATTVGRTVRVR